MIPIVAPLTRGAYCGANCGCGAIIDFIVGFVISLPPVLYLKEYFCN